MSNLKLLHPFNNQSVHLFYLERPKQYCLDYLEEMQIKVNEKFESVFAEAAALGREEELFKITKEEKESHDRLVAFHRRLNEQPLTEDEDDTPRPEPKDFFVSLLQLLLYSSYQCHILL